MGWKYDNYPPGVTGCEFQITDGLPPEPAGRIAYCPICKKLTGKHAKGEPKNVFTCKNPSCNTLYFDVDTRQVIHVI